MMVVYLPGRGMTGPSGLPCRGRRLCRQMAVPRALQLVGTRPVAMLACPILWTGRGRWLPPWRFWPVRMLVLMVAGRLLMLMLVVTTARFRSCVMHEAKVSLVRWRVGPQLLVQVLRSCRAVWLLLGRTVAFLLNFCSLPRQLVVPRTHLWRRVPLIDVFAAPGLLVLRWFLRRRVACSMYRYQNVCVVHETKDSHIRRCVRT